MHEQLVLPTLVPDECDNHAIQIEEEHQEVEAEFDERLLLVHVQLPEDLCSVEEVLIFEDSERRTY